MDTMPPAKKLGRPKGSVNIISRKATRRLEQLGFDPMEEMVKLYDEVCIEIQFVLYDPITELRREKYSQMGLAQLLNTKKSIVESLLKYAYHGLDTKGLEDANSPAKPVIINMAPGTYASDKPLVNAIASAIKISPELKNDLEHSTYDPSLEKE